MLIKSHNSLHENAPKTKLTHLEVSGTNVLRWENPNGFSASWAVQAGETGEEQTEIVLLGTAVVAGTAGTLTANTLYEHPADTPIYAIKYDQIVFERSTAGITGTATPMTNGTITYQADHEFTQFDDTSGSSTYGYRTYYRNSVLNATTTESDWLTPSGFAYYSLAKLRERVKEKLWNADYIKENSVFDNWINEYREQLVQEVISVNEDYALGTVQVGFGTNGFGTISTSDFVQPRRVWVTYNGEDWYQSTKMNVNDFVPDQQFSTVHPYHYWFGDNIIGIKPSDAGTAEITFYRLGTILVNDTDELPVPMRGHTKGFVDYCLAQAFLKDNKTNEFTIKTAEANAVKRDFVNKIVPRDKTGPTMIDLIEPISGESGIY